MSRKNPIRARRGLTLIEATLAMFVLSLVLVSVTQGVALSVKYQKRTDDEVRGAMLAAELAERIAQYDYSEMSSIALGRDLGEVALTPATFDDIDDWHGYTESPPTFADWTDMGFLDGWTRSVTVQWVSRSAPDTVSAGDEGAKLITVVVTRADGGEVGRVTRLCFDTNDLGGD